MKVYFAKKKKTKQIKKYFLFWTFQNIFFYPWNTILQRHLYGLCDAVVIFYLLLTLFKNTYKKIKMSYKIFLVQCEKYFSEIYISSFSLMLG